MQAGAFTALAATARGGCASSSDQVQAAGMEAMTPPNSRSHRSTANYYSILNRGVTQLSHNTPQTRRVLYDRARAVLATQLQGQDPVQIAHDQLCLERAILQMEASPQSKIDPKASTGTGWRSMGFVIEPFIRIGNLIQYVRARRSFKRSQSVQSCRALSLVTNVLFLVRSLAFASAQALRQMFMLGCQFDQRFAYGRIERLARQSLPFLRLSMKLLISLGVWLVAGHGHPSPRDPESGGRRASSR